MKKVIAILMTITLTLALVACGSDTGKTSDEATADSSEQTAKPDRETEQAAQAETTAGIMTTENGTKALVVYFSVTGNTKVVAETIAGLQGADIYEIVPEQPYTDEDLNYNDKSARATADQNNPDARPAIQGSITDFEQYDIVYVGYAGGIIGLN